ncbi:sulfurtransferase [Bacillus massilinigeriensis]|uniref:sulfurtransferase n=1 Tax=Bacillus massilionigeriensis TaxID=1805475 RepID=UPI00096B1A43|nr:sulfurtransferase [Bacillus massilionigeriensis]
MNDFVDCLWLKEHLSQEKIRIVDCRFHMGQPEEGKNLFLQEHIPGAVYFDLEKDLSSPIEKHGGRHPLPNFEIFRALLESSGIDRDTTVIAYDGGQEAFASRLWWLMKYVGHDKVYILNGGFTEWKRADYPVEQSIPSYPKTNISFNFQPQMLATFEEVKSIVENPRPDVVLIDSRERNRYLGLNEPIDKKAGHIPGAINKVWTDGFQDGNFKNNSEQKDRFNNIHPSSQVIVYCGSGVTATPNYLALKAAGFKNIKLYIGSFSDWISYEENVVETGEAPK